MKWFTGHTVVRVEAAGPMACDLPELRMDAMPQEMLPETSLISVPLTNPGRDSDINNGNDDRNWSVYPIY